MFVNNGAMQYASNGATTTGCHIVMTWGKTVTWYADSYNETYGKEWQQNGTHLYNYVAIG